MPARARPLRFEVTRAAIGRSAAGCKRAQARPTDAAPRPAPTLAERLRAKATACASSPRSRRADWDELVGRGVGRRGRLRRRRADVQPDPGDDADRRRRHAAAARAGARRGPRASPRALRRFDLGGSIGIDFPTLADKADRQRGRRRAGEALADWPHERTAMNGFGFVQLVARLERPRCSTASARDRAGAAARLLLRRAERVDGAGRDRCSPAIPRCRQLSARMAATNLRRRTGREVRWRERSGPCARRRPHAQTRAAMTSPPLPDLPQAARQPNSPRSARPAAATATSCSGSTMAMPCPARRADPEDMAPEDRLNGD